MTVKQESGRRRYVVPPKHTLCSSFSSLLFLSFFLFLFFLSQDEAFGLLAYLRTYLLYQPIIYSEFSFYCCCFVLFAESPERDIMCLATGSECLIMSTISQCKASLNLFSSAIYKKKRRKKKRVFFVFETSSFLQLLSVRIDFYQLFHVTVSALAIVTGQRLKATITGILYNADNCKILYIITRQLHI